MNLGTNNESYTSRVQSGVKPPHSESMLRMQGTQKFPHFLRLALAILYILCFPSLPSHAGTPTLVQSSTNELTGVPGEALTLKITVTTPRAYPIQLKVPTQPGLLLRKVSSTPITKNEAGDYVQSRILLWQGLEGGTLILSNLTVAIQGELHPVPPATVTIQTVTPTEPPTPEAAP